MRILFKVEHVLYFRGNQRRGQVSVFPEYGWSCLSGVRHQLGVIHFSACFSAVRFFLILVEPGIFSYTSVYVSHACIHTSSCSVTPVSFFMGILFLLCLFFSRNHIFYPLGSAVQKRCNECAIKEEEPT